MKPIWHTPKKEELYLFSYRNRLFALCRRSVANSKDGSFFAFMENITIYAAPWNQQLLGALIEEIQRESLRQETDRINVYRGMKVGEWRWVPMVYNMHRPMDSVVLDPHQKDNFEADVQDFLHPTTYQWYMEHSLNYRRSYLFHGPPGTGKTSLCLGMATFFGLDIYTLSLNSLDENRLALLFQGLPRRCVVLLEDIDTAGLPKRPNDMDATQVGICEDQFLSNHDDKSPTKLGPITLSSLINTLDGVATKDGRILIMTTNHRAKLDNALIRPGRVDVEVKFELASAFIVQKLFLAFYAPVSILDDNGNNQLAKNSTPYPKDKINTLSVEFARHVYGGHFSHAEIQNYLIGHRKDPVSAVAGASEWFKTKAVNRE
ncbi:uncharacterized protein N7483_010331 [Penicillium malachiteum]|uniref:uncharacterized protein n=1 Tax=Penicillium malachiteum TaxID=1324776 RepID=UPI002546C5E4|nr:uncharacterized protein N7483_010331 [Penicillium malachiteum]KAJ5713150.1 hypothetical protein N7483_010331 [Penicillium malachiteum]